MPYPIEGLDKPIQLSIKLPQYNYFYGDVIEAEISVDAIPRNASVSARAVLMDLDGDLLVETGTELEKDEAQSKTMSVSFDTLNYDAHAWPLEITVGSYVEVDGSRLFISAPFRINAKTAQFDSVGFSQVKGEYLEIPVNLDVVVPGYYFVSGILYSATSKLPLVYLEAEGLLNQGLDSLFLNAHVYALKEGGDEGPYEFKNIKVERWSDEAIPQDVSGKVPEGTYSVEGYAFSDYDDVSYIDPLKEERMRLMQGLSTL